MTIAEYLEQRNHAIRKDHDHIRDARVFDFNYMPDEPLMREEAKPIIDACLRYLSTGIPNHLFIFGSRGSGKTLMVNYIGRLLQKCHGARLLYVNCRQHNTSFKILAHLLNVNPRGHSLDELWQRFCDAHSRKMILVLDEVDLISDKDRNRDILYLISRASRSYTAVLLSNHPRFLNTLDESVRSTLQPELIHFRNYDATQILSILRERARLGLVNQSRVAVGKIAAFIARTTNGDVRVAIKALYYLAVEGTDDIEHVLQRAQRDLVTDVLSDLNDRSLLMLRAMPSTPEPFVKAVYQRYRELSRELHEEPFSYVYFYSNLSYLQSIGLIMLVSTKVGRTYTNRIQLLFDSELLDTVWRMRFG